MSLSDILIVASIITGLTSVPFVASSITSDYGPTGNIILDMDNSSSVPSELSRSLTSGKFEQTYETPFGELHVLMESDKVYQELSRPDRRTVVEQTPEKTEWKLISQDYTLTVTRTGEKVVDKFTSPDGYLEKVKKMGNTEEIVRGNVEGEYQEAKELLNQDLGKINEIMEEHMEIPGTEKKIDVYINEFLSNSRENQTEWVEIYNGREEEISLENWTLKDRDNNPNELEGTIYSEDYIIITEDDLDFKLNDDNGDEIILKDENGKIVDHITYGTEEIPSPEEGNSTGRIPDGSDEWEEFSEPSPEGSNS